MLSLSELWFLLISVLFVGFFVLEGYDFGVGTVARFLGKNDTEKRVYINTIGPFWDANEVWLLTAGGAMFAAYPHWYATMFSGLYIPLVFMLLALILRGVAFEFRGKIDSPRWKNNWDWAIFFGSALPPLLWGVALTNLMTGLPIDENMEFVGGFLQLLHPFALLGGVMFVLLCMVHGLQFISLKTAGELRDRARNLSKKVTPATIIILVVFAGIGLVKTDIFTNHGNIWLIVPILSVVTLIAAYVLNNKERDGWAFFMTSLSIVTLISSVFIGMFPRVLISSISAANDLTVYTASSGDYTLKLMTIVAITLLPIVLGYTIWSYYVFRKRIKNEDQLTY